MNVELRYICQSHSFNIFKNVVYLSHYGVQESQIVAPNCMLYLMRRRRIPQRSLNDALLVGPALQNNLIDIVVHFRFYKVVC